MTDIEYVSYGMFLNKEATEDPGLLSAHISSSIDDIRNGIDKRSEEGYKPRDIGMESPSDILTEVGRGIWHFHNQLRSYYELARLVEFMSSRFASDIFRQTLVNYAKENLDEVDEHNGTKIYGIKSGQLSSIERRVDRWVDMDSSVKKLAPSTLLSLVSTFDSAFSDLAKVLLRARPQRYTGSDRQYSVSEILKLNSIDNIIDKVVNDEIDQLMNKSHSDQIIFFEKSFDVSIRENYERWGDFIEIFERRNLVAHGSLKVNSRYIDNCKNAKHEISKREIGEYLEVDRKYLVDSVDILLEFGILLAFSAWQKQMPEAIGDAFDTIVEVSFNLLQDGQASVAERILQHAVSLKKNCPDATRKRMIINLAIAAKTLNEEVDLDAILLKSDWTAAGLDFKLCLAAVKGEIMEVVELLPVIFAAKAMEISHLREWPAFRWARKDESFRKAVEEVFGEPLHAENIASSVEKSGGEPREDIDRD